MVKGKNPMPVSRPSVTASSAFAHGIDGFPPPYWSAQGAALYLGDVRACLRAMPTRSVHCIVTSPPYWGLRDYGTGTWEGGDKDCDHDSSKMEKRTRETYNNSGNYTSAFVDKVERGLDELGRVCLRCGAKRIDAQLGSESRPDCLGWARGENCADADWTTGCHVCRIVLVMRELRRVLRDDGTLWLNYGDTYSGGKSGRDDSGDNGRFAGPRINPTQRKPTQGLPPGNLVGVPWRVALALQADRWILRQDIIWHKPSPMPESVTNRCTKAHEYVFLLTKSNRYYCDMEAIKERQSSAGMERAKSPRCTNRKNGLDPDAAVRNPNTDEDARLRELEGNGANKRSVWTVASQGYPGAHFATFAPRLIEPMILAGTSECGCCAKCGAPYERVVTKTTIPRTEGGDHFGRGSPPDCWNDVNGKLGQHREYAGNVISNLVGWRKMCGCNTDEVVPSVVLDPFVGSGTTVATALLLGRAGVGIDLSETYLRENAIPRIEAAIRGERISRKSTVVVKRGKPPTPERVF